MDDEAKSNDVRAVCVWHTGESAFYAWAQFICQKVLEKRV
jgi:4-alpha-glucanotransferase